MDRQQRHKRIRSKIKGTSQRPRLSVFRSSKHIYAQIIDDVAHNTLAAISDVSIKKGKMTKSELAKKIGQELAKKAKGKDIKNIVFDRGGYKYHGRIKMVADGAREEGLEF